MKYNWTIDDLKNKYSLLEKLASKETDPLKLDLILMDIETLGDFIEEEENKYNEDMPKLLDNYELAKDTLSSHKFLWEDIIFFGNTSKNQINDNLELKTNSLSKKDIIELTHDFYKTFLDKFFFHNFLVQFRQRNDHLIFLKDNYESEYLGESINISSLRESFIRIMRNNDIEDVLTTIHEYEHATSIIINPYHVIDANHTYCEIDTIFMELIGADYLDNIFKDNEAFKTKVSTHSRFGCTADLLKSKIDLIKAEELYYKDGYTTNKILKESAKKYCGLISEEVDDIIQYGSLSYDYTISYIIAVELYNMYQNDKDKALYYLRKLILLNTKDELDYYNSIKKMGIIPNMSMREYQRDLKERILKLKKN